MSQDAVEAFASTVWAIMIGQPGLFALTMGACIAFEQSEESSNIHVTFQERTPQVEGHHFSPAGCTPPPTRGGGNNDDDDDDDDDDDNDHDDAPPEPYSYTCDRLSAWQPCHNHPPRARAMRTMLTPPTPFHAEDTDSGIRCNVLYLHDDCLLLILNNLIHELAHGFRRLVFWRSHVDGVPQVMPWTNGVGAAAQAGLRAALQTAGLWGRMLLDGAAQASERGLHSGFVLEHLMHRGILVGLFGALQLRSAADGSPVELAQPMRFALIQRRESHLEVPPRFPEMATFTGQQVLPTDENIEAVWARPMLTWEAPRNAVRFRNSCCGGDAPGTRGCPRSLGQISSYEPADAPLPTPPASPPPEEAVVCALCTDIAKRLDFCDHGCDHGCDHP